MCSMFPLIVTLYPSTIVLDLFLAALSSLKHWRIHEQYLLNKLPLIWDAPSLGLQVPGPPYVLASAPLKSAYFLTAGSGHQAVTL